MAIAELVVNIIANQADFSKGMNQLTQRLTSTSKRIQSAGKELSKLSVPLVAMGGFATKSAIEFESAFAGVRKTIDATPDEFAKISDEIKRLSTVIPATTTELAGIMEAAGQLGIKTKNLTGFTEVMAKLGTATNMTSQQAADELARFANITDMAQEDFDKLGSTIVALGNNFAGTESEITSMGLRLAGAGKQVGMSEAQIMGFSTALVSVGINAEAGGTAFSKVFKKIAVEVELGTEKVGEFAKIAQMPVQEFSELFKKDAASAVEAFVVGLGKAKAPLVDLVALGKGWQDVRMQDSILRLAGNSKILTEALDLSVEAWVENNALNKEAGERYKTLQSQLLITKNVFGLLLIEIGDRLTPVVAILNEKIRDGINWFRGLSDVSKNILIVLGAMVAAVGPAIFVFGTLASNLLSIGKAANAVKVILPDLGKTILILSSHISKTLIPAILGAVKATWAFMTTPLGAAIMVTVGVLALLIANWESVKEVIDEVITFATEVIDGFCSWFAETFPGITEVLSDVSNWFGTFFDDVAGAFNQWQDQFLAGWDRVTGAMTSAAKFISKTWNELTGNVSGSMNELTAKQQAWINKAKEQNMSVAQYREHLKKFRVDTKELAKATEQSTEETNKNTEATKQGTKATKGGSSAKKEAKEATEKQSKAEKELEKEIVKRFKAEEKLKKQTDSIVAVLGSEAVPELNNFKTKIQEIIDQNPEKTMIELGKEIGVVAREALEAGASVEELKDTLKEVKDENTGSWFSKMFSPSKDGSSFGDAIAEEIQGGLMTGLESLIKGGNSMDYQNAMEGIATSLAGAAGNAIGGPVGSAIASSIAGQLSSDLYQALDSVFRGNSSDLQSVIDKSILGKLLKYNPVTGPFVALFQSLLGGKDAEANARRILTNTINRAVDQVRETSGIDIADFYLPGGRDAFDPFVDGAGKVTTRVGQLFDTLSAETQAQFLQMGTALGAVFDIADLDSGQFGQLLAINFGMGANSLNDLQLIVQQMGLSAEDAGKKIEETWLKGDISAKQFLQSQAMITDLFSKGIPGAIGDTTKAFSTFQEKGLESGARALDSIGDIGAEAMEKLDAAGNRAINSLADLRADLLASGHGVEDVDKFMQALANNGIESIEQLRDVTALQAAGIVSSLQDSAFAFGDVKTSVDDLKKKIDEIKSKEIDIKVNVKTSYDNQSTKDILQSNVQSVIPSAMGNVFDRGALKRFAKGGVVSNLTTFPIGTMAEQGPEAIMPLERTADGRLGVLQAAGNSGGTVINIDARGADIGASERIRQQMENFMDRRNRNNGSRI